MSLRTFRILIACTLISLVIWFVYPVFWHAESTTLERLRSMHGYGAVLSPSAVGNFAWALTAMQIGGMTGLWSLQPWGRWVLLASLVGNVVLAPLIGVAIQTPAEVCLGFVSTILEGALVAIAFVIPLSTLKPPRAAPPVSA